MPKRRIGWQLMTIALLLPLGARAQTAHVDPLTLTTRDAHQELLIVADPYISADRYKDKNIFGKKSFYDAGIIAIDVYFRNDNDKPIRIDLDTIQLVVAQPGQDRQRLDALSAEEVTDRTLLEKATDPTIRRRPLSFPGTIHNSGKSKEWNEMATTLRSVALATDVLGPHATTKGFLFFDMNHEFDAIRYSQLYIPDLAFMGNNQALFFFEIDLGTAPNK
jgi:hypothetical protein